MVGIWDTMYITLHDSMTYLDNQKRNVLRLQKVNEKIRKI